MELSHRVVMVLSAQVQRQTNKTASEMLSSCLKFKSLPSQAIQQAYHNNYAKRI